MSIPNITDTHTYCSFGHWLEGEPEARVDSSGHLMIYPVGPVGFTLSLTISRWRDLSRCVENAIAEHRRQELRERLDTDMNESPVMSESPALRDLIETEGL